MLVLYIVYHIWNFVYLSVEIRYLISLDSFYSYLKIKLKFKRYGNIIFFQVTDTNDNPPVFKESAYSFDIPENAARGSIIGAVEAVDADTGSNAQLTYAVISDWANDVFSLNPQTGIFTLTARLDYEEVRSTKIHNKINVFL